jgi:peptidoglycan hydrolase CwlO-like protein
MTPSRCIVATVAAALLIGALPSTAQAATSAPSSAPSPAPSDAPTPAGTKPPSVADLSAARARLKDLEEDITAGESGAKRLQTQIRELSFAVADEQGTLKEVDANLQATQTKVLETKQRLQALRLQIRARARSLYKSGPTELIGVLLGASSMRDLIGRITFASSLARQDKKLVLETGKKQGELRKIHDYQERLHDQQTAAVAAVEARQREITDVFARQQAVLAKLAHARGEALALIGRLEAVLGSDGLGSIKRVAGRGMTISYGEWAEAFLGSIGAPVVRDNLVAVVAWEASEGTQATWNPLATTMPWPGATTYNSHNVRNYKTMQDGLDATKATLLRPTHGYEKILDNLEKGAEAMETGKAINKSDWCRGCTDGQYVIGIIPAVEQYYERYAD